MYKMLRIEERYIPLLYTPFPSTLDPLRFLFHLFSLCVFVSYKHRVVDAKLIHTTLVNQIFFRLKNTHIKVICSTVANF